MQFLISIQNFILNSSVLANIMMAY